jgi:Domain of unknown function (DUF6484)
MVASKSSRRVESEGPQSAKVIRLPVAASGATLRAAASLVLGRLVRLDSGARVVFPGSAGAVPARTLVPLGPSAVGASVALLFEDGDPARPLIAGVVQDEAAVGRGPTVELDGRQLCLSAQRKIVLRCGKASITLTRDGKIVVRGAHVLSRSSGVNRLQGGSVRIN